MMSDEPSQSRCPINELPTEILCDIFSHCVDHSSARVLMQPNTKIAPMSLCHVCATWRAVVLATPFFWSHLRFELPLNWHSNGRPYTWDAERFMRRLEWLRWWRCNLGAMSPYLQVEVRWNTSAKSKSHGRRLPESACEFLLELMSSAQYISVGRLYRYLVQWHTKGGYVVRPHPKAHTVVSTWSSVSEFDVWTYNQHLISLLTQNRSTLRSLAIENTKFGAQELTDPLSHWAALTHISLGRVLIALDTWFSFIRSLRALQSGSFELSLLDEDFENYTRPSIGILPFLTMLRIDASQHWDEPGTYPLKAVFDNLQLPALRTLSLASRLGNWSDPTSLAEVHAALLSAPATTKLSLGISFVQPHSPHANAEITGQTPVGHNPTPLAEHAPRLTHVSFTLPSVVRRSSMVQFIDRIFASSGWLDLKNPASTVREVTFVAADPNFESSGPSERIDGEEEVADRHLVMSEVMKFIRDEVVVGFQEEAPLEVRRAVWGW